MKTDSYKYSHMSKDYGKRYSKTYSEGYYYYQWELLEKDLLISLLKEEKERGAKTYLDFACGTGRLLKEGEIIFESSYGYDVSESMLDICKDTCQNSTIKCLDITETETNEKFDVITAFRFFLNAEMELKEIILQELHKLLNDDGVLIANIHTTPTSPMGIAYRIRNKLKGNNTPTLSLKEFETILNKNGFEIISSQYYGFLPRTGWAFGELAKYLLIPVERFGRLLKPLSNFAAQSFIVKCKKSA